MSDDDPRADLPPHDPQWELEPRWSAADRARLERARAKLRTGPGLAAVRDPEDEAADKSA